MFCKKKRFTKTQKKIKTKRHGKKEQADFTKIQWYMYKHLCMYNHTHTHTYFSFKRKRQLIKQIDSENKNTHRHIRW